MSAQAVRQPANDIEVVSSAKQAATLLHPLRLRILEHLRAPDSASGIARRLQLPRQKVNYHLRELEGEGFIEPVEERRKGNCVERIVRATATHYLIGPQALGALAADAEQTPDRFSWAYLVAVAAKAVRDLSTLRRRADKAEQRLSTFTLQSEVRVASPAALNAFTNELSDAVAHVVAKHHNEAAPDGRQFTCFLGAYPTVTRGEDGDESAVLSQE